MFTVVNVLIFRGYLRIKFHLIGPLNTGAAIFAQIFLERSNFFQRECDNLCNNIWMYDVLCGSFECVFMCVSVCGSSLLMLWCECKRRRRRREDPIHIIFNVCHTYTIKGRLSDVKDAYIKMKFFCQLLRWRPWFSMINCYHTLLQLLFYRFRWFSVWGLSLCSIGSGACYLLLSNLKITNTYLFNWSSALIGLGASNCNFLVF